MPDLHSVTLISTDIRSVESVRELKNLTFLDVSYSPIETIEHLSALNDLSTLRLTGTLIEKIDLSEVSQTLRYLNISDTSITDLSTINRLNNISTLDTGRAPIEDFNFLRSLSNIHHLNISGCPTNDSTAVSDLPYIEGIDASNTKIADLQWCSKLFSLLYLSISNTAISSLEPIAQLRNLRRLDISKTRVSDLTPLGELTYLARGPRGGRTGGLFFSGAPIDDPIIRDFNRLKKADRAEKVIGLIRSRLGLSPIDQSNLVDEETAPLLPPQGAGPHFTISSDENIITFEEPSNIDVDGNNVARLSSLKPKIIQIVRELLGNLSSNEQPHLVRAVKGYAEEVSKPLSSINFDLLFGEGLFLEEAAAAAKRDLSLRLLPPLEDNAEALLNTLLRLHGVFILSSRAGLENLEAAERYEQQPEREAERNDALAELAVKLGVHSDIASDRVIGYLNSLSDAKVDETAKRQSFKTGTVRNIVVVLAAGASIAALPATATYLEGVSGGLLATGASYLVLEGLKKSAPFLQVAGIISKQIESLTVSEIDRVAAKIAGRSFQTYARFVEENEALLRRIANSYTESRWLNEHLNWIKEIKDEESQVDLENQQNFRDGL